VTTFRAGLEGFSYEDLYQPAGLRRLAERFDESLQQADPALFAEFDAYRKAGGKGLAAPVESELLIRVSRHLSDFVARLFRLEDEVKALGQRLTGGRNRTSRRARTASCRRRGCGC
jgi:hypothetical protein